MPGIVRIDNIRHTHFSRNPKIAEYLKTYDYVKEFGEGVDRMCRELASMGTKEPHYQLVAFIMKATVYASALATETGFTEGLQSKKKEPTSRKQIIDIIYQDNHITTASIANMLGISRQAVSKHIKALQEQGILRRVGPDFGGHWEIISK